MNFNLDDYIRKVPDFPKPGVLFYDITSILLDTKAFGYCIDSMLDMYAPYPLDAVAAIEARGFLFAAPFALRAGLPLIPIRKKGKLPGKVLAKSYSLEYGTAEIEVQVDDIPKGKNILLMDDLIATGGTLGAATQLIREAGAEVTNIFGVIGLPFLHYDKALEGIRIHTLINYDSE
ncbi:MAG: adenine phosphoribosyltransferase [Spirochaetaceae bacterium]|jgi:adenine phosphoribosyltransferase|nr:adenine phosphoribosyltransferase [Spirochaetaceae bacterium]